MMIWEKSASWKCWRMWNYWQCFRLLCLKFLSSFCLLSVKPKKGFHILFFFFWLSSQSGKNNPLFIGGNDCAWYTHYLNKKNETKNKKNCMIISIKNPLLTGFLSFLVNNGIPNQSIVTIFSNFNFLS